MTTNLTRVTGIAVIAIYVSDLQKAKKSLLPLQKNEPFYFERASRSQVRVDPSFLGMTATAYFIYNQDKGSRLEGRWIKKKSKKESSEFS